MKPAALTVAGIALAAGLNAQEVTPDSVINDAYNRQNTHMHYGKAPLEFYGSGSGDGYTVTLADAEAIQNGSESDFLVGVQEAI